MADGRFAPSPTGDLHLGNLRTALLAWLFARSAGSRFLMRMEDLDVGRVRPEFEERQLRDLATIGLDWDGPVVRQSERIPLYEDALAKLDRGGLVYACYCTRREIREAASAPQGVPAEGVYPGTCRDLTPAQRAEREAAGRKPALRLRGGGAVDDFVLRRNDGAFAYNLAVIVDDSDQGIEQVVRGADLADSTPRQLHLAKLLALREPTYVHVPLMLGPDGKRLAKRHGAVTLADRSESPGEVLSEIAASVGLCEPGERVGAGDLVGRFDPAKLQAWHSSSR